VQNGGDKQNAKPPSGQGTTTQRKLKIYMIKRKSAGNLFVINAIKKEKKRVKKKKARG